LQRKPDNRLGLRGACEVREHSWLKYYPWKDLYEKKIDSPYLPKLGDNFDAKYCNAKDKLSNDTMERYDKILRQDNYKTAFKDFNFYSNECDPNDKNNSKEKKFFNPHFNIQSNYPKILNNNLESNNSLKQELYSKKNSDEKMNLTLIETKFSKIKMMSSSVSSGSIIRNYRQSSGSMISSSSTTSSGVNSTNVLHLRSGSSVNMNY